MSGDLAEVKKGLKSGKGRGICVVSKI